MTDGHFRERNEPQSSEHACHVTMTTKKKVTMAGIEEATQIVEGNKVRKRMGVRSHWALDIKVRNLSFIWKEMRSHR